MKIYLDVDDTLNDFREHVIKLGVPKWSRPYYTEPKDTWTPEEVEIDKAIVALMDSEDFWPNIPTKQDWYDLVREASNWGTVYLLTAYPSYCKNIKMIKEQKKQYCADTLFFPKSRTIICDRKDKQKYAKDASCILIDDSAKNCQEWNAAGGFAIQFKTIDRAIGQLEEMFNVHV